MATEAQRLPARIGDGGPERYRPIDGDGGRDPARMEPELVLRVEFVDPADFGSDLSIVWPCVADMFDWP